MARTPGRKPSLRRRRSTRPLAGGAERGSRLPLRLRHGNGLAVRKPERGGGAWARAFGPESFFVELQRPYERRRRAPQCRPARNWPRRFGVRTVATRATRTRHHPLPGTARSRTCSFANPEPHLAGRLASLSAAANRESVLACSQRRGGALSRSIATPVERAGELAARALEFDLTEDLGYRYPRLLRETGEPAIRQLARVLRPAPSRSATATPTGSKRRGAPAPRRRAEADRRARPSPAFFLLHWEVLELARECAPRGFAAARSRATSSRRAGAAGARWARSSAT